MKVQLKACIKLKCILIADVRNFRIAQILKGVCSNIEIVGGACLQN